MKTVTMCCLFFFLPSAQSETHAQTYTCQSGSLKSLDWLIGTWQSPLSKGRVRLEIWERTHENILTGKAMVIKDKDTSIVEHLLLTEMGGCLIYLAAPKNQEPTAFTLTDTTGGEWVFSNSEHDFPSRVVYPTTSHNALRVRIEGTLNGAPRSIPFEFVRLQ